MSDDALHQWPLLPPARSPHPILAAMGWHLGARPTDQGQLALAGLYHCVAWGWHDDGRLLVLRLTGARDPAEEPVAVAVPKTGETWLLCNRPTEVIPALIAQWLRFVRSAQWDALANEMTRWRGDDDPHGLGRDPGITEVRKLLADGDRRAVLCLDEAETRTAMEARWLAARALAAQAPRAAFMDLLADLEEGELPDVTSVSALGPWTGAGLLSSLWTNGCRSLSERLPLVMHAGALPPSDDNGWGYGSPMVSDAAGARTDASARHDVATMLATHFANEPGAAQDPLLIATAAPAQDVYSYRGAAHLDAARALIDAGEWERARIATLGIAFWTRGASMRPELRSLGLYIEVLAKLGHELPLAVAMRQMEILRTRSGHE